MRAAALVFLALYLLVGLRSVFWYGTFPRLREKGWSPLAAAALCVFDLVLWPLNAIDRHRQSDQSTQPPKP